MPLVVYVDADGTRRDIDVPDGENVMRGALYNGIAGIVGECGGALSCATCHCYVDAEWLDRLPPLSTEENDLLDSAAAARKPNSRLSCQIVMGADLDGLRVALPETQY